MSFSHKHLLRSVAALALAGGLAMGLTLAFAGEDEAGTERPWLGVALTQSGEGAVTIASVIEDSPAEAGGLVAGERIVSINGESIAVVQDAIRAIRDSDVGGSVMLELEGEEGARRSVSVILAGRPKSSFAFALGGRDFKLDGKKLENLREHLGELQGQWLQKGEPSGYLGVGVIQPSDDLRAALGALEGEGVLVNTVEAESPAEVAGLRAGDVITAVDGETVSSSSELTRMIRSRDPATSVTLGVIRDKAPLTLTATLGESEHRVFMFRGTGEGLHGFRFGPNEMRLFEGVSPDDIDFDIDFDAIDESVREALEKLEQFEVDVHEDDEGEGVRREILIGPRVGSIDA